MLVWLLLLLGGRRTLIARLFQSRDNGVNPQQQDGRFHCRLECLRLHGKRLPNAQHVHVRDLARVTVDPKRGAVAFRVLGTQGRQRTNNILATVADQRHGNDRQSVRESLVWPLRHPFYGATLLL